MASLALAAVISACVAVFLIPSALKADAETTWSDPQFKEEYVCGDTVTVPSLEVTVGDETSVNATAVVTYPDGKATTETKLLLEKAGQYVIEYTAIVGGKVYRKTYSFNVKAVAYTFKSSDSVAVYGEYTEFGAKSEGLIVRLANSDSITFTKLIDVRNSTSVDMFVKGFITPDARGSADFSKLIVTLTDSEDDSVYLTYQMKKSSQLGVSYVTVGGNGQDQVGAEVGQGKIHTNNIYGTPAYVSFVAQTNKTQMVDGIETTYAADRAPDAIQFAFAYDAETVSAYSSTVQIADMDDADFYRTLWYGFPSGRARLSISASGYNNVTANFCLTEAAGISAADLDENGFTETDAPEITIDVDDENDMPQAEKGLYYPVPSATAYDVYSGNCDVSVAVYYNYGSKNQTSVGITGGKFKPTLEGNYVIEYSAKDAFSNVGKKTLSVRAVTKVDDIAITLEKSEDTLTLGNALVPSEAAVSGGSGKIELKKYVVFEGKQEELTDGYLPEKEGVYTVKYVAVDYIGKTCERTYNVTAVRTDKPTLAEKVVLPRVYISGTAYSLPDVAVNVYSTGSLEKKSATFRITDKNGEKTYASGSKFTPEVSENNDKIKVECLYGNTVLYEAEVPAIIAKIGTQIRTDRYFYGAEEISTTDETGANYKRGLASIIGSECGKSGWTFANPLIAEGLALKLKTVKNLTAFESFTFALTDSSDEKQTVSVTVPTSVGSKIICGSKTYDSSLALSGGADLVFEYSDETLTITSGGKKVVVALTEYADGEKFNGFSSDKVYMELAVNKVTAQSRYVIEEVSGNVISRAFGDYSAPSFVLPENEGDKQTVGTIYTLVKGVCGDVFAPNTSVSMTVYAPDGTIVTDVNGQKLENVSPFTDYKVLLSQTGKYRASYDISEVDWVGNSWTYAYTINVPDKVAPTIKFADGGIKTAKVGDTVAIPSFTVSDNITAKDKISVNVFVINPNGRLIYLGNNALIKCEYKGEYKFVVYAADMVESVGADGSITLKQGNVATAEYVITVGD